MRPSHQTGFRASRAGALLAAVLATLVTGPAASATASDAKPAGRADAVAGRYIVAYKPSVRNPGAETDRQERARGFEARLRFRSAIKGFAARLSTAQVRALRADPDVASVAPDREVRALAAVALLPGEGIPPTGVRRVQAATTTTAREASDAAVAVIDTGIDLDHPDLNAAHGVNCVAPGAAAEDDNGHGTHVAGTVAAENDGGGVVGVAPGTRVYAVKVLDGTGGGTDSQVICGIDWVTANADRLGIEVANMSLGAPGENDRNCGATNDDLLHQAICRSTAAGITHVVAAGNDGWDIGALPPDTPASYPEVLTVTAMADGDGRGGAAGAAPDCASDAGDPDDHYASFSNYATRAEDTAHTIAAPGVCIRSTARGGGYAVESGTSMAAPHVAGAVALCIDEGAAAGPCAGKSPAQIIEQMRAEAQAQRGAEPEYGFAGDPAGPNALGDYFGYLVSTAFEGAGTPTPSEPQPGGPGGGSAPTGDGSATTGGGPAPTIPDTTAPRASIFLVAGQRIRSLVRRGLRLRLRASEPGVARARLLLDRRTAARLGLARARRVVVGGGSAELTASRRDLLVVRLKPAARRRIGRLRRVTLTLRLTLSDAAGNSRSLSRRFVVRP